MALSPVVRAASLLFASRLTGLALLAALALLGMAGPASALQSKDQQACINATNKGFARVAAAEAKAAADCLKAAAAGTPIQPTIESCISADSDGKIAAAAAKATDGVAKACTEAPGFGPVDLTGANAVAGATGVRTAILGELFGADIDAALATKAADGDAAACQGALTKAVDRCWKARVGAYSKCVSDGLASTITDAAGLSACRASDPDGEVEKACVAGVQSAIDKKCGGVDLDARLPGCKCRYTQDCIALTIANDESAALTAAVNLPALDPSLPFVRVAQSTVVGPWISPAHGEFVASVLLGRQADAPLACPLAAINIYTAQSPEAELAYSQAIAPLLANQQVRVLFSKTAPVDLTGTSPAFLVQENQATPLYADAQDFLHLATRR